MQPLLDTDPPNPLAAHTLREGARHLSSIKDLISVGSKNREVLVPFYELMMGPAQQILDRWFDSEILKTTLATDAVIGSSSYNHISPDPDP